MLPKNTEIHMRYSKLRGNTKALKQWPQRRAKFNTVAEIPDKRRALRDVPEIWWFGCVWCRSSSLMIRRLQGMTEQSSIESVGINVTCRANTSPLHLSSRATPCIKTQKIITSHTKKLPVWGTSGKIDVMKMHSAFVSESSNHKVIKVF